MARPSTTGNTASGGYGVSGGPQTAEQAGASRTYTKCALDAKRVMDKKMADAKKEYETAKVACGPIPLGVSPKLTTQAERTAAKRSLIGFTGVTTRSNLV